MQKIIPVVRENKRLVAYCAAMAWPFTTDLWLSISHSIFGIQMRTGAGLLYLALSVFGALLGLLMLGAHVYNSKKSKVKPAYMSAACAGVLIAALLSFLSLFFISAESYCGGAYGDCGRWI
jgi:hypothetical protein